MAHRPDYESADYKEGYEDGKQEARKQWQGLSDEELELYTWLHPQLKDIVKQVEQTLKEKNNE